MKLNQLVQTVRDKANFASLRDYIEFCLRFLDFVRDGLQAVIVSQNEPHYRFYQFRDDGHFNITRPINSRLMLNAENSTMLSDRFLNVIRNARDTGSDDKANRAVICHSIYTVQQSIGATLDALPSGQTNIARKINGDLFERLMRMLLNETGVDCRSGIITVPVQAAGEIQFSMSYQHDLLLYRNDELRVIGSVKTSSKDRLGKIFIDKFLYSRLTETATPHIAIFLNDVQRKRSRQENRYSVGSTFLPGHFKGYSIRLNPLDGVYYCDLRPNLESDPFLKKHIKTIDHLFCDDLRTLLNSLPEIKTES